MSWYGHRESITKNRPEGDSIFFGSLLHSELEHLNPRNQTLENGNP